MKNTAKVIGEKLRQLRIAKGLDQKDLAEKTGVSQGYISNIENGRVTASYKTLEKLAQPLGVSVKVFFEDLDDIPLDHPHVYPHLDREIKLMLADAQIVPYVRFALDLYEFGFDKKDLEYLKTVLLRHRKK